MAGRRASYDVNVFVNHWQPSAEYRAYCKTMKEAAMVGWHFYQQQDGDWRWSRKAANGKIIAASTESYRSRVHCVENAVMSGYVAISTDKGAWISESDG